MKKSVFKFFALILVACMLLPMMAACDGGETPTEAPTGAPTEAPTGAPTEAPTDEPTEAPTDEPTEAPTDEPTEAPTDEPTEAPTDEPTEAPTDTPTEAPTENTDPSNATYTVSLKTAGGMALADVMIFIQDGTNIVGYATTDENGEASVDIPQKDTYTVTVPNTPTGYTAQESYAFVGTHADVVLTSAVITDGGSPKEGYKLGDVMYDFTVTTYDDQEEITLSEVLKEKDMVLINYWYDGCVYCLQEFPEMNEVYQRYSDSVEVIALSPYDNDTEIANFMDKYIGKGALPAEGLSFPVAYDDQGIVVQFNPLGAPTSVIVDRYGVVCLIVTGAMSGYQFEAIFDYFTGDDYQQQIIEDPSVLIPNEDPTDTPITDEQPSSPLAGTYDITMWVSEMDGVAKQFKQQIAAFMEANPGIIINVSIKGVTEEEASSKIVADVASAPDMYCFAQNQLARLVQASALAGPGGDIATLIKNSNDAGSVAAASVEGILYAYPMTSDNGYYMYYDTSIISEEEAESLEAIIAACEDSGKLFRFALENAWYTASFFFATGCNSNWTMNEAGEFVSVDDNFNSTNGLIAMKGMQKLAQSPIYDSDSDIFMNAGVVVTGIWNADAAVAHFGENLGVTDLPSFTVDGQSYHLGSYTGNKLLGVKPQTDAKKAAVLSLLAQYLTNEECQSQRYESFQWGPSNLAAQQSEAVQANPSIAALVKQNAYGQPQGQIHGSWWDIAKVLGAEAKAATSEQDLKDALADYQAAIDAISQMTDEQKQAWSVIGSICGTNWDTDFAMTKVNDTTWESAVLALEAGQEFKVRQGASWDVNFGLNGELYGFNIFVETTGNYTVRFTYDGITADIELILIDTD